MITTVTRLSRVSEGEVRRGIFIGCWGSGLTFFMEESYKTRNWLGLGKVGDIIGFIKGRKRLEKSPNSHQIITKHTVYSAISMNLWVCTTNTNTWEALGEWSTGSVRKLNHLFLVWPLTLVLLYAWNLGLLLLDCPQSKPLVSWFSSRNFTFWLQI